MSFFFLKSFEKLTYLWKNYLRKKKSRNRKEILSRIKQNKTTDKFKNVQRNITNSLMAMNTKVCEMLKFVEIMLSLLSVKYK